MSEHGPVLVDRDARRRPRSSWRAAWSDAKGHALSTLSTWSYVRDAVTLGGWKAVALPTIVCALVTAALLSAAFAAAVIASATHGSTGQALAVIGGSVLVSQLVTAIQNRRLGRRLFIVAAVRVDALPDGWAIAWIDVPAATAPEAKAALLRGAFLYVEVTYFRHGENATLAAYYRLGEEHEHALTLVSDALGPNPHTLKTVTQ
jgi:hypothetical protein